MPHNRRHATLFMLGIISFAVIVLRYQALPKDDETLSKIFERGESPLFVGTVTDDPDVQNGSAKFTMRVEHMDGKKMPGKHKLLVKVDTGAVRYGDEVSIRGKLKKPELIVNEDGRTFDYAAYLSKENIFYTISVRGDENVRVLSNGHGNKLVESLYTFKRGFIDRINRILPSPHSFLASGLIISGKGSLSKELQADFQRVGLIHIVVLSGFNISIIGEAITRMFSFLPAALGAICGGAGIILFSIMTGGGSTVIRSAIMSLIGLYARVSGKRNSALVSLIVAGTIMLMWNPALALHDPSFQLSFAATLGLILYAEPIERLLTPFVLPKGLLSLVSSTLATQIFTMPLIMKLSGVISLVALPVNVIVLPLIPFTMFFVFVAGAASFISQFLSMLPGFVSWMLLSYELGVVSHAAVLPFAAVTLPPMPAYMVIASYILLLWVGIKLNGKMPGGIMKVELKSTAPI